MTVRNVVSAGALTVAACFLAASGQIGAAGATPRAAGKLDAAPPALATTHAHAPGEGSAAQLSPSRVAGGVCGDIATIDKLVVRRHNSFPENHLRFSFPAVLTRGAVSGRQAARALCALPPMPSGVFHCPADLGVAYDLAFSAPGAKLATVILEPAGCETVSGLGSLRSAARSPGFWRTLGAALGLRSANQATFAGSLPN